MAHAHPAKKNAVRVLLADDEAMVRQTLSLLLRHHGCLVVEAADGQEAVARYVQDQKAIDVLLLDIDMPKLTGIEALESIRKQCGRTNAVLLSGAPVEMSCATGEGDTVILQKPIDTEELVRTVRTLAGKGE